MKQSGPIDFSIIITTKNSLGVIERLIEIIKEQDFGYSREFIFMDNDSRDGTVDYLRSCGLENQRIIHVPEGRFSHSRTRMEAAENAVGRYVIFFTDDIVPRGKSFLRQLTKPLLEKKASAGYGVFQIDPEHADPIDAYIHNDWHRLIEDISGPVSDSDWASMSPEERRRLSNFDNCCSCIDRQVLLKVRFPDVPYGEDMFFAKRMILGGHRIALCRQAKFSHWHKMSFSYLLKRMCIDQYLSKSEFQIYYIRSKSRVMGAIAKRIVHRSLISIFRLKIPFRAKIYWIFYNIKILFADFWGKYIGSLNPEVEKKWWALADKKLFRIQRKIVRGILERSIIRY